MHDTDPTDAAPARLRAITDPLKGAPPPGVWVLWHGPQAQALLQHALLRGRPATQADHDAAPPRPADLAAPVDLAPVAYLTWTEDGRRWLVQADHNGPYVSAYVCGLAVGEEVSAQRPRSTGT